jgi:hypothetical protein
MMWIIRNLISGNYNSNKKCSQEEFDSIVKSHIFPEIYVSLDFPFWQPCSTDSSYWIIKGGDFDACRYYVRFNVF